MNMYRFFTFNHVILIVAIIGLSSFGWAQDQVFPEQYKDALLDNTKITEVTLKEGTYHVKGFVKYKSDTKEILRNLNGMGAQEATLLTLDKSKKPYAFSVSFKSK